MNNKTKELCLSLARAETEEAVIKILKDARLWDDESLWVDYGHLPNNYSIIGNQQSSADAALVEKIVNSVDAVLMRECLRRGKNPKSFEAPQSIDEALHDFFNIDGGNLANICKERRKELADNILLVVTGSKQKPSYSIIDKGEGQTPQDIPNTFLSLVKENKLDVPFVQGRFGMGSTGVLPFCGDNQIQLIISKRDPKILDKNSDEISYNWGFTIVRRFDAKGKMKNSVFRYLAPDGKIMSFSAVSLPLIPGKYPNAYEKSLEWGTFIKLYEYQLPKKLRGISVFNLYFHLSLLLPSIPLPVTIYERRKGYKEDNLYTILNGLTVRLEENKYKDIENGFPTSDEIIIDNQKFKIKIFALKPNTKEYTRERYTGNGKKSIIFSFNGQAHAFFPKNFFERKKVGMSYLSDLLVVLVDCSLIDKRTYELLFMNSRDRLFDSKIRRELEKRLEDVIGKHPGLLELRNRRRLEAIKNKLMDNKPLKEIVEKVISKSPSLSHFFISGKTIFNPFDLRKVGIIDEYNGKMYPSYFKLKKSFTLDKPKNAMLNHSFRVEFETDASNDYFTRDSYSGNFKLKVYNDNISCNCNYHLSLWNGKGTLSVTLPKEINEGDILKCETSVLDISRVDPFKEEFYVKVIEDKSRSTLSGEPNNPPPGGEGESKRKRPSKLDLPNMIEVTKKDWDKYDFDKESALLVKETGEEGYDFFINMDNAFLLSETKTRSKIDPKILQEQYKVGMVLVGLSLLNLYEREKRIKNKDDNLDESEDVSIYDTIQHVTRAISPILLPMITTLNEIGN